MKLLRNLTGITKIFKYQDFAEKVPEPENGNPLQEDGPYLTFSEDDLKRIHKNTEAKPKEAEDTDNAKSAAIVAEEAQAQAVLKEARKQAEILLSQAKEEAEVLINKTRAEAIQVLEEAEEDASKLKQTAFEEGHQSGYERGLVEGEQMGKEQHLLAANEKYRDFFSAIREAIDNIDSQKEAILQRHMQDLSELSLTIAEKIIHVALESCGEVVKRMIASAAAPSMDKQWAKITISAKDADMMQQDGINIRHVLEEISDRIRLIVVKEAPLGTCLVEFPDQAIDAGASTQMRNMKALVRNSEKE